MKIKNAKIFIIAIAGVLLAAAGVLAQQNKPDAGFGLEEGGAAIYGIGAGVGAGQDFNYQLDGANFNTLEYMKKIEELMKASTGKMNDEIYIEITARIAACHKGAMITDSIFNDLNDPYDVTSQEYAAYAYQNMARMTDQEGGDDYDEWIKKYGERTKELEKNNCVFNTNPDYDPNATTTPPCIDGDGDDPDRTGTVFYYGQTASAGNEHYVCNPCKYKDECAGDFAVEQICKDGKPADNRHKCEYGCFAGRCLTAGEADKQLCEGQCLEACPAGTIDLAAGGCPKKDGPKTVCCQKVFDKPEASGTCAGSCMKSSACPEGYENKGTDSCVQEENCYKCGFFNLFTCCNYTKNACCVPKSDALPAAPEKCNGYCSAGGCYAGSINKGAADCAPIQTCKACGFFGLKKCCEYQPQTCCEYPQPVSDCSSGICTYNECPSGTVDVGIASCGKEKKCKTGCLGFCKKCDKKQTRCCMAAGGEKCDKGACQESAACPAGYKSIGAADCGSYEKTKNCGFLNMSKCKEPAARTCCVPE